MTIQEKRKALKGAYEGKKWADKVDGMTDAQVTAVYIRLKSQGMV